MASIIAPLYSLLGLVRLTIWLLAGVLGGCEASDHRTAFTSDLKNVLVLEFNKCFGLPHVAKSGTTRMLSAGAKTLFCPQECPRPSVQFPSSSFID